MRGNHTPDRTQLSPIRTNNSHAAVCRGPLQLFDWKESPFRTVQAEKLLGSLVRIHYDWRLARVIDEHDNVLDELNWDGKRTIRSISKRLQMIQSGRMTPEVRTLLERFPEANPDPLGAISDDTWPMTDEAENQTFLQASNLLAKSGVAESAGDLDRRMDMLVSALIEEQSAWTTREARCVEWIGLFISDADLDLQREEIPLAVFQSNDIVQVSELLGASEPIHHPSETEWSSIKGNADAVIKSTDNIEDLKLAIRELAISYLPSLSALMGPLSASKLTVLAGGRQRLARMPSGSLQVLGAHAAMSAHRRGALPPQHGSVLFSMPQVSHSPRWVRGKIARFIAGKASIAVRIDHFGGESWGPKRIEEINSEVEQIKSKFPKPPKRG